MPYIYLSVDIETDGPIPGEFSMISLGAAAFLQDGSSSTPFATFEINITPIPGAKTDPKTMSWWNTQPEAWSHIHQEPIREPADAMQAFASWIESLPGCMNSPPGLTTPGTFFVGPTKIIFVGYPATFDHMFVYWYWVKFLGTAPPFGFQVLRLRQAQPPLPTNHQAEHAQDMVHRLPKAHPHPAPRRHRSRRPLPQHAPPARTVIYPPGDHDNDLEDHHPPQDRLLPHPKL